MLHSDISRALSPTVANNLFEIFELLAGIWKGRFALAADDRPEKEWSLPEIEAALKVAKKAGWVVDCPGGWLLVPADRRPKPSPQRTMFGDE